MSGYGLHALIVDPSPESRSYLWQATLAETSFRNVKAINTLENALTHLAQGISYHVVLITGSQDKERLSSFVQKAKETSGGAEAAYVLVLQSSDQTRTNVAFSIVGGSDGFLFAPFSVNSLREVAAIAERVKKEHERDRMVAALDLLMREVQENLDALALAKITEMPESQFHQKLKQSAVAVRKIASADPKLYHEVVINLFDDALPRESCDYDGASERVKELHRQKLKALAKEKLLRK